MAKRFTATEKWDDPWFCSLSAEDKLFWFYLLDKCDHAGIWQVNWALASFHIPGLKKMDDFHGRVEVISPEKWFIPKFIDFQYGHLEPNNRAHSSVIRILEKEGAYKALNTPLQGRKDMDKDMDKDKDKDNPRKAKKDFTEDFKRFWMEYPKKIGKDKAFEAWQKKNPPFDKCLKTLEWQIASDQWLKDGGQYIPNPATWINQGRWDDIRPGYDVVKCSVCGDEGSLPKGARGRPVCRKCKGGAVAGPIKGS